MFEHLRVARVSSVLLAIAIGSIAALPVSRAIPNQRSAATVRQSFPKRILYIEGGPRPEPKFINRSMSDIGGPRVVLLQRTTDNKYLRMNVDAPDELRDGFPRTNEELFAYDGLILGPIEARAFTLEQHQMIADFVGVHGGGLLVLGGALSLGEGGWAGTPLAHVVPVVFESEAAGASRVSELSRISPTPAGLSHRAIHIADSASEAMRLWLELPPVTTVNGVHEAPGAVTLLTATDGDGSDHIVLAVQNQGRGKSAVFTVQDSWRWVMTAKIDSPVHERFWRSLLAWLVDGVPES